MAPSLQPNKASQILTSASKHSYGIPAICVYNLEGIIATVRAATAKRSPAMLLLFPWAQTYSSTVLAHAAAEAARKAPIPITVHLDHAQTPEAVKEAADMDGCYDSIMVDMSHYDHAENLRLTKELTAYCHARGILVEAECGRIEGGEDGVSDTADLEGLMTTPEQAREFVDTGVDWLAPAFGNVHGMYGPRGIQLEFERLEKIKREVGDVSLVLHGTDGFDRGIYEECVKAGITKCNINRVVNQRLTKVWKEGEGGLTGLMEEGTKGMQEEIEVLMDCLGSSGKADF
ncbi:uncharacterized protein KY384_002243 [Bacidia gigantensis]|uniref:uncharacterized protein n=1 Tax=Bacidia gigantensis TaxID=2732470 RepID=UPI001D0362D8|nr:uncharacterized protein KY384_002243 [Bacidia gigantensis]KAG8533460.1 hypothetical protein KY384_002243 [Bacidia gigantensis]